MVLWSWGGPLLLYGQATGQLLGTVKDVSGAVVPGATVTVVSEETGVSRELKTDASGAYLVPFLPVGHYTVRVSSAGLQEAAEKDIRLQVDESREVDFTLAPAVAHQAVEVTSDVFLETTNASLGQVITSQQVAELPLNGRDFVQLATLTPGTAKETNPNSFFNGGGSSETSIRGSYSLSVAGSRADSTDWLLDGVDNNELTAGAIAILPSIDALQEFKVLTSNYSAEYGTRGGPAVLLTTKSGTNDFHGSLFDFLRNTSLDARSFFALDREVFIQNQFGGSLGGPLKKDKTFFFFDYQGKRTRQGVTYDATVPTLAMRNGDFSEPFAGIGQLYNPYSTRTVGGQVVRDSFVCDSGGSPLPANSSGLQAAGAPCNKIPPSLINPIAQTMINFYPAPNVPNALVGDFVNSPVKQFKEGELDLRLDHSFSSQDSVFARFSYDQATEFLPVGESAGFLDPDGFSSSQSLADHGRNAALSETHVFSPATLNKATVGYNRIFNHILSFADGSCISQKLGIPGANLGGISCGLTDTLIGGGFWGLGDRGFAPFQGGTNIFFISDSLDMIRGRHDIKAGGEIRANQMNVLTNAFQDGFWVFTNTWTSAVANGFAGAGGGNNMADFLLGLPDLALHDQTFQGTVTGRRWKMYRPFIEDDWRVTPNLTLNLGLAYPLVTPVVEAHNRQSNYNFGTGQFLIPGKGSDGRVGLSLDKTALEPRLGLAWSPGGDRRTSIRAGYAIFHDSSWNLGAPGLWENPPFFEESAYAGFFPDLCPFSANVCAGTMTPTGKSMSQGFPLLTEPSDPSQFLPYGNLESQNLNFKLGRVQQFNLDVERQIPGDVLLTVGYAGARSSHLLVGGINLNVHSPNACPGGSSPVAGYSFGCGMPSVPWPNWTYIYDINDRGSSRYDSLQVKAETKSGKQGLYALVAYTYARAWDNGLVDGLGSSIGATYYPLPNTGRADKGFSQIQLNHNFTASVIYQLPFGKGKKFGKGWSGAANALLGNWEVDAIEHATSGFPLFVVASTNNSGAPFQWNGQNFNRPDRICNGRLSHWTVQEFFNTSCFTDNPNTLLPGELGNSARTPLFGPPLVNTDFSAVKNFPLPFRERTALQFRAEFFNIFNHPQFFLPGGSPAQGVQDVDSANFGEITQTVNNPRLIQFALKLTF
jgi:hypothetical protein